MADFVDPLAAVLLSTTDAQVWATEWCRVARDLIDGARFPEDLIDEGWMTTWFANAIETGRAAGRAELPSAP